MTITRYFFFFYWGCYCGCANKVMIRVFNLFNRTFQIEIYWLPLHLKGAYPMSGWIKISPLLPLWRNYYFNGIDTFLEKKCSRSIDHFIITSIKITCVEVYRTIWHMLSPFVNNSLAQQMQLKTISLHIYKMVYT